MQLQKIPLYNNWMSEKGETWYQRCTIIYQSNSNNKSGISLIVFLLDVMKLREIIKNGKKDLLSVKLNI
jgi:hypothetical protein